MKIYIQRKPRGGPENLWKIALRIHKGNRGVEVARAVADKLRKEDPHYVVRLKMFHPLFPVRKRNAFVTQEQRVESARQCAMNHGAARAAHALFISANAVIESSPK